METFSYKNNQLGFESLTGWRSLSDLAKGQEHAFYLYSLGSVQNRVDHLSKALSGLDFKIHYAMKANAHPEILSLMKKNNCGVDTVSLGEMNYAMENGFQAEDIILSGVGKNKKELQESVERGIHQINVESLPELKRLGDICKSLNKEGRFGVRLNPDIKVDTHPYISTGFRENKFGVPEKQLNEAIKIVESYQPWLKWQGLSVHIGSQIRNLAPLVESAEALLRVKKFLTHYDIDVSVLDIGGGLGINYQTGDESEELAMIEMYGARLKKVLADFKGRLALEPGRVLVARSGILMAQVEYIKNNGYKNFVIVNSGMNHLLRPCLYEAFHRILPLQKDQSKSKTLFDIVGPICESSDVLGYDRPLVTPQEGDWLAVMDAGAYGYTMSNTYNLHEKPNQFSL